MKVLHKAKDGDALFPFTLPFTYSYEVENSKLFAFFPEGGLRHRGLEKIAEGKEYKDISLLMNVLDDSSAPLQSILYQTFIENILLISKPKKLEYVRVLFSEFARAASHFLTLGKTAYTVAHPLLFFYAHEEYEKFIRFRKLITGGRFNDSFFRIGALAKDTDAEFFFLSEKLLDDMKKALLEFEKFFLKSKSAKASLIGKGVLSKEDALEHSVTGPVLRASSVAYDVRKEKPYLAYSDFSFEIPFGSAGDCYDRTLVRCFEIKESLRIVEQVLTRFPKDEYFSDDLRFKGTFKDSLSSDIFVHAQHMKKHTESLFIEKGEYQFSGESSNGETGFYLVSEGANKPSRFRIRRPSLFNFSVLENILKGSPEKDIKMILATINISGGELDG